MEIVILLAVLVLHGKIDSIPSNASRFGALYGFQGVPKCNYEQLEYLSRLVDLGTQLYKKAYGISP